MDAERKRKLTQAAVLITIGLVIAGVDVWLWLSPPEGDTISEQSLGWAQAHPIAMLGIGVLLGHLFWPQRPSTPRAG